MYFALTGLTSTSIYKQVNTYPLKNYIPSLCQGLFFIKGVDGEYDSFVVFLILVASLSIFWKIILLLKIPLLYEFFIADMLSTMMKLGGR